MGKQDVKAAFTDVLNIISSNTARSISHSATNYSSTKINIQENNNSTRCRNFSFQNDSTSYYASSDIYSDQSVTQDLIITILQQLTDEQNLNKKGGGPFGGQYATFVATIKDKLESTLTSDTLVTVGENTSNVNVGIQVCNGSVGGRNVIIARHHEIFRYYNNLYSQNTTVQSLAADISNYIAGTQDLKSTGLLVVIIRMIALIVIVICVVIGLGVVATIVISVKF